MIVGNWCADISFLNKCNVLSERISVMNKVFTCEQL